MYVLRGTDLVSVSADTMRHMTTPPPPEQPQHPGSSAPVTEIGHRVLSGREALRLSQQEFAEHLKVMQHHLSRWERGRVPITAIRAAWLNQELSKLERQSVEREAPVSAWGPRPGPL